MAFDLSLSLWQGAHKKIIREALHRKVGSGGRRHVFWYKSQQEADLVFKDYKLYVERTGNDPPRRVVEANILELSQRVVDIQGEYIVKLQALFRGTVARMFFRLLILERCRILETRIQSAMTIQRFYRRRKAMNLRLTMLEEIAAEELHKTYIERLAEERAAIDQKETVKSLQQAYRLESTAAKTAVMLGKIPYAMNGTKALGVMREASGLSDALMAPAKSFVNYEKQRVKKIELQARLNRLHNQELNRRKKAREDMAWYWEGRELPDTREALEFQKLIQAKNPKSPNPKSSEGSESSLPPVRGARAADPAAPAEASQTAAVSHSKATSLPTLVGQELGVQVGRPHVLNGGLRLLMAGKRTLNQQGGLDEETMMGKLKRLLSERSNRRPRKSSEPLGNGGTTASSGTEATRSASAQSLLQSLSLINK